MQCAVIVLGGNQFLAQALSRFGLLRYFKFETEKGAEFHDEQLRTVAEGTQSVAPRLALASEAPGSP